MYVEGLVWVLKALVGMEGIGYVGIIQELNFNFLIDPFIHVCKPTSEDIDS